MDFIEKTPVGIGIDLVSISELKELHERLGESFINKTFSTREVKEADIAPDFYRFLSGRFAVKEAVFKAIAPLTKKKNFDFRIVETVNNPDGSPTIYINEKMRGILDEANIDSILISITSQDDYVVAIAQAIRKK